MIGSKRHLIIWALVAAVFFGSCQSNARHYEKALALYQEGLELSTVNSLAAAETFSQALLELEGCNQELTDVQRLKGQTEDQLGSMYWKHGMKEEALQLHRDAIEIFRLMPGSVLLMNALQNAGRVAASLQRVDEAEQYYVEALEIAKVQSSKKLSKDIMLELCRDVYMEKGEFEKVIELVTDALEKGARPDLCCLTLGMAYNNLGNDRLAIEYLNQATQSENTDVRMPAYQVLYQIYQLQKDYPKAFQCFERYNENMMQAQDEQYNEEMQCIKRDYDFQVQNNNLETKQKLKSVYLYSALVVMLVALFVTLLLLRQKTLKDKLKAEENQRQLDVAMSKNKVFLTALALSEKILGNTVDVNFEEKEWNDYLELIDLVYSDFTKKLMEQYPTLTKSDLQICGLTRQGFSNQVISVMMNMQANSYARRKYRIKQDKMNGAEDDRSFEVLINEI